MVSERESDGQDREAGALRCAVCGTPYDAGDRFCARCGAVLAAPEPPLAEPAPPAAQPRDDAAWVLGARPTTVIGAGIALLLLAVLLLAVGQRDDTGTIVMLAICTAPLGLLTLLIGIGRYVAGAARRG